MKVESLWSLPANVDSRSICTCSAIHRLPSRFRSFALCRPVSCTVLTICLNSSICGADKVGEIAQAVRENDSDVFEDLQ